MSRHTAIFKAVFCIAIVLAIHKTAFATYTTNAVPYTNTWDFTAYQNGYAVTNLPGWNAGQNDLSCITNLTYTPPPSQSLTPTNHQVLCLNTVDAILTNNISSQVSASLPVIFDTVMNFQPNPSTPTILSNGGTNDIGIKFSIFVDANTNLNIYHGWLNGSAGNWASNGITVITNQVTPNQSLAINTTQWFRVTVTFDASKKDSNGVIFPAMQVAINGTNVQSQDAYNQGDYQNWPNTTTHPTTTSPTGTWFRTAINNTNTANTATNVQYINKIGFQGTGNFDELQVNAKGTLTVISVYGTPSPTVGTTTFNYSNQVTAIVALPMPIGTTQYVCSGASVVGLDPSSWTQVNKTNVFLTLTNNATLTWLWQTNYWLAVSNNGTGTTFGNTWTNIGAGSVTGSWYLAGSTAVVTASPPAGVTWSAPHGETNVMSFAVTGALVTVVMSQPAVIIANFQTPVNSAGITVGMYQNINGLYVQFVSLDEGNEGTFTVTVTDAFGHTWTGTISATGIAGANVYQLLTQGLSIGSSYSIVITDLSGGGQTFTATLTGFANNVTMTQTGVAIQFNSNPGDTYQIQWTPSLGGTWTTVLTTNAVDVQSSVFINFQDPVSPSTGFFRVVDSTLSSQ